MPVPVRAFAAAFPGALHVSIALPSAVSLNSCHITMLSSHHLTHHLQCCSICSPDFRCSGHGNDDTEHTRCRGRSCRCRSWWCKRRGGGAPPGAPPATPLPALAAGGRPRGCLRWRTRPSQRRCPPVGGPLPDAPCGSSSPHRAQQVWPVL